MAIQIPNAGAGDGASGDNEFVLWTKVINNFSDQANAASRLVGTDIGNLTPAEDLYKVAFGRGNITTITGGDLNNAMSVGRYSATNNDTNTPSSGFWVLDSFASVNASSSSVSQMAYGRNGNQGVAYRQYASPSWSPWAIFYTTANTTKDANGFIKAASPIVKVFADKVELNDDAVDQDVAYKKNGIGDYTITTQSGLSTDGWYIELPKDMNGNPKVAVTLEETDGVISLKTYKRIFSMETFTFEPDLDNPLDIPDTRWIDLRLNEIPVEIEYDTQTEV